MEEKNGNFCNTVYSKGSFGLKDEQWNDNEMPVDMNKDRPTECI